MTPLTATPGTNQAAADRLIGYSIKESAGTPAAATLEIRKASITGQVVDFVNLAASESGRLFYPKSIPMEGGTYVKVLTGTVSMILWHE